MIRLEPEETIFSPARCYVLLFFRHSPVPWNQAGNNDETIAEFQENGVLEEIPDGAKYRLTSKGEAWVNAILSTPMPVAVWVDPRTTSKILHREAVEGDTKYARTI